MIVAERSEASNLDNGSQLAFACVYVDVCNFMLYKGMQ